MAEPGNSMQSDFEAASEAARQSSTDWILDLARGQGGTDAKPQQPAATPAAPAGAPSKTPSATPAGSVAPMPGPANDESWGQWFENLVTSAGKAATASADAEEAAGAAGQQMGGAVAGAVGREFMGRGAASWDQLKKDWQASHPPVEAFNNADFWEANKKQFDATVAAGKLPLDAFGLVMTPFSTAIGLGAKAGAKALNAISPTLFPEDQTAQDIEKASMVLGPKGGLRGALAGTRAAGVAGEAAGAAGAGEAAGGEAAAGAPPTVTMKTAEGPQPIKVTPELKAKMKAFVEGRSGDSPIEVAIEGLANPDTTAQTIADIAKIIPKGEVKPVDVSKANAYALQMHPDEIMARIRPNFPSDEAFAAAGAVLHSASETFWNAARKYGETGAAEDRAVAERAYAVLNKYIGDFRAGGTDLGRGMRIRQEVTQATPEHLASIQKMVGEAAGEDLEIVLKKAAALEDPEKVAGWLSTLRWMKSREGLIFGYQNSLLSNPKSIAKEFLSDLVTASWDTLVRGAAEIAGGVTPGATQTLAYGYTSSFFDSLRLAARALAKGESQFAPEYQSIEGNIRKPKSRVAELAKGMAKEGEAEQPGSAAIRYLRMAIPTQWQMAADDFNKAWHYNAYRRMYAYEQATREGGDAAAVTDRMRRLLEVTPQNIHEAAMGKALQNSFQEPLQGNLARMAEFVEGANIGPNGEVPAGRAVMPFTKVPLNLGRWPVRNSPLATMTRRYWDDVQAGGARRSLANAAAGMGGAVLTGAGALAYNDMLTGYGPHDPDTRRFWLDTHQPYSFKDPKGGWHSYLGLGPVSMLLGPAADTADIIRFAKTGQADDIQNAMWSFAFGAGQAMLAPANMMGVGNFFDALMNPEQNAKYFGENLVTGMVVPQVVWGVERATDPWRRAHYDLLDNIKAHTPGLSKDLPPQVDIWGDKVRWPQGELGALTGTPFADAFSPIAYKPPGEAEPISTWIYENRLAFPRGEEGRIIGPPGRVQTYSSGGASTQVQLTPQQLYRLKTLAGNELKDPETKLGAKDLFNALVEGKGPRDLQREWNAGSPELQAVMIQRIWTKYRGAAKQQLLAEDEELRDRVTDGLKLRGAALMRGSGGQAPVAAPQVQ